MKNKSFFYLQYDKINWSNQEKTKINASVNRFIIENIFLKKAGTTLNIFDIGFGIGFFLKMASQKLAKKYKHLRLEGCEPSQKNYRYFIQHPIIKQSNSIVKTYNKPFLEVHTKEKFDFVTAIYVFPHFIPNELLKAAKKIYSLLNKKGQFILVVADEKYLQQKLYKKRDLFIEEDTLNFNGKKYTEVLHYSDIPKIGKVIDYNREERFYIDLFEQKKFKLRQKVNLNDKDFVCTIFTFEK